MKSKEIRQKEALERNKVHSALSTKQKILKLDMKYGKDLGAKKERARLALQLEEEAKAPPKVEKKEKKPYQKPKKS